MIDSIAFSFLLEQKIQGQPAFDGRQARPVIHGIFIFLFCVYVAIKSGSRDCPANAIETLC